MRKIKQIHERSFHASHDDCKTRIYTDTYIYGESRKYNETQSKYAKSWKQSTVISKKELSKFSNTDEFLKDQTRLLMLRWFARDTAHIRDQPDNICICYLFI